MKLQMNTENKVFALVIGIIAVLFILELSNIPLGRYPIYVEIHGTWIFIGILVISLLLGANIADKI